MVYCTAFFMLYSVVFPGLDFPGFPGLISNKEFPGLSFPGFPGLYSGEFREDPRYATTNEVFLYVQDDLVEVRSLLWQMKNTKSRKKVTSLIKKALVRSNHACDMLSC